MALEHDLDTDLARAVREAGSQSAFGRLVGKRQSTIREWLMADKVPPESVLKVEEATGISRHLLRPDVYGPEPTREAAA
ncbi:transcriptional regulator [Sphingomonas panaciterrae]|uniref:transcriptional regulator n=1 Tax=Sphingomonas panaciterrae TaxID=1462999 RepID=UPI002FF15F9F